MLLMQLRVALKPKPNMKIYKCMQVANSLCLAHAVGEMS